MNEINLWSATGYWRLDQFGGFFVVGWTPGVALILKAMCDFDGRQRSLLSRHQSLQ